MKVRTLVARLDKKTKVTILSRETGAYLYVGDTKICGATQENKDFCKMLCDRKIADIVAVAEGSVVLYVYGGYPDNE